MYNYTLDHSINTLPSGTPFKVKDLDKPYWHSFTDTDKRLLGKEFFKDVNNTVYPNVKFVRKNSANCAIYKKI